MIHSVDSFIYNRVNLTVFLTFILGKDFGYLIMKRTFQPSRIKRARTHGFRARMRTRGGRGVINARRAKGRTRLAL